MPEAARAAGFRMTGPMLGFPARITPRRKPFRSPAAGNPADRKERLERFQWALERTKALGLSDLMLHAGFLPEPTDPDRKPFLDTLGKVSELAKARGITVAFETGQETATLLRRTLDELKCPNLKVNFDPANVILYDMGDPLKAVETLGPDIRSVHVKDAIRTKVKGTWGEEVPLGKGEVNIKQFVKTLKKWLQRSPVHWPRGGDQRVSSIWAHGIRYLKECWRGVRVVEDRC